MDAITHATAGSCIAYLVAAYRKEELSMGDKVVLIVSGATVALLPDMTKKFGDLLGHSLLIAPILIIPVSIITKLLMKQHRLITLWFSHLLSVTLGHILLDFLQNGVALLYPFIKTEFSYHIINPYELWILVPLIISLITIIVSKKAYKTVVLIGVILALFLGGKSYYRESVLKNLNQIYADDRPNQIVLQANNNLRWHYMVRSKYFIIDGISSKGNITETDRLYLGEDGSKEVLLMIQENEKRIIISQPTLNDGKQTVLEVYSQQTNGTWRKMEEDEATEVLKNNNFSSGS